MILLVAFIHVQDEKSLIAVPELVGGTIKPSSIRQSMILAVAFIQVHAQKFLPLIQMSAFRKCYCVSVHPQALSQNQQFKSRPGDVSMSPWKHEGCYSSVSDKKA